MKTCLWVGESGGWNRAEGKEVAQRLHATDPSIAREIPRIWELAHS